MARVMETPMKRATNSTSRKSTAMPKRMLGRIPPNSSDLREKRTSKIIDGRESTCSTARLLSDALLPVPGFSHTYSGTTEYQTTGRSSRLAAAFKGKTTVGVFDSLVSWFPSWNGTPKPSFNPAAAPFVRSSGTLSMGVVRNKSATPNSGTRLARYWREKGAQTVISIAPDARCAQP